MTTSRNVPTGNTLWVDAVNGVDATAVRGNLAKPYLTITAAITAAVAGDTIMVLPGVYTAALTMKDDVSVEGIDQDRCIITLSLAAATAVVMAERMVFANFTINGTGTSGSSTLVSFGGTTARTSTLRHIQGLGTASGGNVRGVSMQGTGVAVGTHVTVDNCYFRGDGLAAGLHGTGASGGAAPLSVWRDCLMLGQSSGGNGFDCVNGTAIVLGTRFLSIAGFGISMVSPGIMGVDSTTQWDTFASTGGTFRRDEVCLQDPYVDDVDFGTSVALNDSTYTTISTAAALAAGTANDVKLHATVQCESVGVLSAVVSLRLFRDGVSASLGDFSYLVQPVDSHFLVSIMQIDPTPGANPVYSLRAICTENSTININAATLVAFL